MPFHWNDTPRHERKKAFTLVEVVVALSIFVFAGIAMVGLLGSGLRTDRDSRDEMQAASIAESIFSTLRATPCSNFAGSSYPLAGFPISTITNSTPVTTTYLAWDGTTTNQANAHFGLIYSVATPAGYTPLLSPVKANVYLCLFWPAQAAATNYATGRLELASGIYLP